MTEILLDEEQNVRNTIPLVEGDSRLGWEASMDYMCDKWHLPEGSFRKVHSLARRVPENSILQKMPRWSNLPPPSSRLQNSFALPVRAG